MPPTENDTDLHALNAQIATLQAQYDEIFKAEKTVVIKDINCLLYTSDAADE